MWKVLKKLISDKNKQVSIIDCVTFDGIEVHDDEKVTNKFNSYFIDSIDRIIESIDKITINTLGVKKEIMGAILLENYVRTRDFKKPAFYS